MTEQNHSITPPPELIERWVDEYIQTKPDCTAPQLIAARAAQWGADCELEACMGWMCGQGWKVPAAELRAARRPKPPSLKRVALLQLDVITKDLDMHGLGCDLSQIRRALESIPDHTSEGGY